MTPLRILVTGSRDWEDVATIRSALEEYDGAPHVVLVSGACPTGADAICEEIAHELGWKVETYPADWELFGKKAGYIRNAAMVDMGADVVLAFIKDKSKGSTSTAYLASLKGIKVIPYEVCSLLRHLDRCGECPGCMAAAKGVDGDFICHRNRFIDTDEEWDRLITSR